MKPLIDTGDPLFRDYLTGFILALVLTVVPFGLVVFKVVPQAQGLAVIAVLAVVQIIVHMRYFLHLNFSPAERNNIMSLAFAAVLILIMAGGTLWIMFNLHYRMMA